MEKSLERVVSIGNNLLMIKAPAVFYFLFLFISACAAGHDLKPIPIESRRVFDADFDKVWDASVFVLNQMNFGIKTIDKTSGIINTDQVITSKRGVFESAHYYAVRNFKGSRQEVAAIKLYIEPTQKNTIVNITASIHELGSSGWFSGESKGVLEKEVLDKIGIKVKQLFAH